MQKTAFFSAKTLFLTSALALLAGLGLTGVSAQAADSGAGADEMRTLTEMMAESKQIDEELAKLKDMNE